MAVVMQEAARRGRAAGVAFDLRSALDRAPGRNDIEKRRVLRRLMRVRRHLERAPAGTTLRDLAELAGYSPWHLQRLFKQVFGVAPHAVATRYRLEHAARLLRETRDALPAICASSGFPNRSAFSRLFKQTYGVSPTDYRHGLRAAE